MRMSVAAAVACLLTTGLSIADQAKAAIRQSTNIGAQGLAPALRLFAEQRDIQIIYRADLVGDRQTSGAIGELTVEEALHQLLSGTGLTYSYLDDNGITIVPNAETSGSSAPASNRSIWRQLRLAQVDPTTTQPTQATLSSEKKEGATVQELEEVVVTGTLIRGIDAPIGTNAVGLTQADIAATGAMSANDILTHVPQVTTAFLQTPTVSANDGGATVTKPNIRDLGRASGSTTLVLVDGHRIAGIGGPDPDVIPPGVLDRIEIVPDGGSSIYGSDAIGGVINFITKKEFDGFEAGARYGIGADYNSTDVNLTAGNSWDNGSAYVSYAYAEHDAILGRDRDYMRQISMNPGYCPPGTIQANGTTYALPSRTPGTMTECDNTDNVSFWPAVRRHSIFAAFNEEFTDAVALDVRAFYTRRETMSHYDFISQSPQTLLVTNANPYFQPIAGETSQLVDTSFAGVFDSRARFNLTEFGITPTLTAQLGGGWQLRLMGNYGTVTQTSTSIGIDDAAKNSALAGTTLATALNPYDIGASNPAVLASIVRDNFNGGVARLYNGRAIADGSLFDLPGGEVRLAVGIEYTKEEAVDNKNSVVTNGSGAVFGQETNLPLALPDYRRHIESVFGELALPIVGSGNAVTGIHSLTFSASARYDEYSDVGNTFNPKFGLTYEPVDWIKARGNWGRSFNAPTPDQRSGLGFAGALPAQLVPGQQAPFTLVLAGAGSDVQPQTAHTWSFGVDVTPAAIPGLSVSATYYNILLEDQIGLLGLDQVAFTPAFADYLKDNQTCASALATYGSLPSFLSPLSTLCALFPQAQMTVVDLRQQNLGKIKQDGIDFNFGYNRPVSFGLINAGLAGSYTLHRKNALVDGAPFVDELDSPGTSPFFFVASVGAQVGDVSASASFNHRQGYDLSPAAVTPRFGTQRQVDSFDTVDLFLAYRLPWWSNETSLTLNVTNVFDEDPPYYNGCLGTALCGFTNGSTLGRLTTVGLRSKF
jgi:iron complex outermembrane recepter protein